MTTAIHLLAQRFPTGVSAQTTGPSGMARRSLNCARTGSMDLPRQCAPCASILRSAMPASPKPLKPSKKASKPIRRAKLKQKRVADSAFSQFVRARDPKCAVCERAASTDAMHFMPRTWRMVRWDSANARGGCRRCHVLLTARPLAWKAIWSQWLGEHETAALELRARTHADIDLIGVAGDLAASRGINFCDSSALLEFRRAFLA